MVLAARGARYNAFMPAAGALRTVTFVPRKYGLDLLGRIREWPTFVLINGPHALAFYEVLLVTAGLAPRRDARRNAIAATRQPARAPRDAL